MHLSAFGTGALSGQQLPGCQTPLPAFGRRRPEPRSLYCTSGAGLSSRPSNGSVAQHVAAACGLVRSRGRGVQRRQWRTQGNGTSGGSANAASQEEDSGISLEDSAAAEGAFENDQAQASAAPQATSPAATSVLAAAIPVPKPSPQQPVTGPRCPGKAYLVVSTVVVVLSAVANRVLYKMALTPLSNYVFFLAQLQTFGYVAVYLGLLAARYRAGKVTAAMLRVPRDNAKVFLLIGAVEAFSALLGFVGAANLPGVVLPLLSQTIMIWQVLLAYTLLRKRLSTAQLWGVLLVVAGVCVSAWPSSGSSPLHDIDPVYAWIFVISMLFPALDTILKERVFRDARQKLGRDLDLFVVNSYGSLAQAGFILLLLPIMTSLRGLSLSALPDYLMQGWQCFQGLTPACGSDCSGAPLLPLAYVATNLVFNIAALNLIRVAGNVVLSLVMSAIVPATIFAFTLPLPYLQAAPPLGPSFLAGAALLLAGLLAYNAPLWAPAVLRRVQAWADEGRGPSSGSGGGRAVNVVT